MCKENTIIFVTPILEGKISKLKEKQFYDDEEALFKDLKVSKYQRWIH